MKRFLKNFYNDMKYTIEFIVYYIITKICFHFYNLEGIEAAVCFGFALLCCFGLTALSYMNDKHKEQK